MEEEQLSPIAVSHLLQHTLRSLCIHDNSQWIYAVFWRILPRNYPPPKWEGHGAYDRSRGNRRNWILVWEDGFCNFNAAAASSSSTRGDDQMNNSMGSTSDCGAAAGPPVYGNSSCDQFQHYHGGHGLQPELFFKMSHEIYNYGEGLIGKVASDHTHKWIYKEPNDDQEINFLSTWHNSVDSHPRTWEAQFQSGIKTIALIAVREGVVQLGAVHKVIEDLSYVVLLRKKLSYIESIPGALLPHPSSSSSFPFKLDHDVHGSCYGTPPDHLHHHDAWHSFQGGNELMMYHHHDHNFNMNNNNNPILKNITPSMSSLEALLSKLPSVVPSPDQLQPHTSHQFVLSPPPPPPLNHHHQHHGVLPLQFMDHKVAKGETQYRDHDNEDQYDNRPQKNNVAGETSTSMPPYGRSQQHHFHHH